MSQIGQNALNLGFFFQFSKVNAVSKEQEILSHIYNNIEIILTNTRESTVQIINCNNKLYLY